MTRRPLFASPLVALLSACSPSAAPAPKAPVPASTPSPTTTTPSAPPPARSETDRRNEALIEAGFQMTSRFSSWSAPPKKPNHIVFFIPRPHEEHQVSFWGDVGTGTMEFRLTGPDGEVLASFSGHEGELAFAFDAPAGRYELDVSRSNDAIGQAVFGVKGGTISSCAPPRDGTLREVAKDDAKGFHWPYLLYVPKGAHASHLLVAPNNAGPTEDLELLRSSGSCDVDAHAELAEHLGTPLLVPLFPRPPQGEGGDDNLYLHALSRAALETKTVANARVDLQLVSMIADAGAVLRREKLDVGPKVFLVGFSASGSFVNRFAVLHPESTMAVASGSPGGWPLAPVATFEGDALPYPVGVSDVAALTGRAVDGAALQRVPFFFFIGDKDKNDAVPHRDSFSAADEALIARHFGDAPVPRWPSAEKLYKAAGMNAEFRIYPGVAHTVSPDMARDVEAFFSTHSR